MASAIVRRMGWDDKHGARPAACVVRRRGARGGPGGGAGAHLPPKPAGRCVVVGAGKSAATMAAALEAAWPDVAMRGVVVTRYGHAVPTRRIRVLEASHPVPDAASEAGARALLAEVAGLGRTTWCWR